MLVAPNPISRDVVPPRMYRKSHDFVTTPSVRLALTCRYRPPPSEYRPGSSTVSTNLGLSKLSCRDTPRPHRPQANPQIEAGFRRTAADMSRRRHRLCPKNEDFLDHYGQRRTRHDGGCTRPFNSTKLPTSG